MNRYAYMILYLTFFLSCASCSPSFVVETAEPMSTNSQFSQSKNSQTSHSSGVVNDGGSLKGAKNPPPIQPLPTGLIKAIQEAGMPIYDGDDPPWVEGVYLAKGSVLVSKYGRSPGSHIGATEYLRNQTKEHSIQRQVIYYALGRGWITGQGNKFTIYMSYNLKNIPEKVCHANWIVSSGIKKEKELHTVDLVYYEPPSVCSGTHWEKQSLVWTLLEETAPPPEENNDFDPDSSPLPSFP